MQQLISKMLEGYEQGSLSRRQLIQGLAALAASAQATPAADSPFHGAGINHIAIRVTDVPRSRDFYRKLLGMPVLQESKTACFLGVRKNFLTLFHNQNAGLDHFCFAIDNFKADSVVEELKRQGLKPRRPSGTDRVYFPDPDGLEVQLSAVDHQP